MNLQKSKIEKVETTTNGYVKVWLTGSEVPMVMSEQAFKNGSWKKPTNFNPHRTA